jgi:hypothetical protein
VDMVVGAGDYAPMRIGLERMIGTLSAVTVPAVLVPGGRECHLRHSRSRAGRRGVHSRRARGQDGPFDFRYTGMCGYAAAFDCSG